MTKPPQMLLIPQPLAQQVVDYLQTRPYGEVHRLIGGMLQLPMAQLTEPPVDEPAEVEA